MYNVRPTLWTISFPGPEPDALLVSTSAAIALAMEPIAVVGVGLRFPHDAVTPEAFWDFLLKSRCASSDWPSDRVNIAAFNTSARQEPSSVSISCTVMLFALLTCSPDRYPWGTLSEGRSQPVRCPLLLHYGPRSCCTGPATMHASGNNLPGPRKRQVSNPSLPLSS